MSRSLQLVLCIALIGIALPLRGGEVIDRIVATVNGKAILQSDVDFAVRYQALVERHAVGSITGRDRKAALDRLIDQELLLQQMSRPSAFAASDSDVGARVEEIRKQYPEARTAEGWKSVLRQFGLEQSEVDELIRTQLKILRFVDVRLRPSVRIENAAIEEYYRTEFLPKLRQAGGHEVPLADVSERIREVLTERQIDGLLGAWLKSLREENEIHTEPAEHRPVDGQTFSRSDDAGTTARQ